MDKGENVLVEWLRNRFGSGAAGVPIGIGDDMAVIEFDDNMMAMTADMLMDRVHFDSTKQPYDLIGRKALACSLSDCAAMACQPRVATISLALPNGLSMDDVKKLYEGIAEIADEFGCCIVGGDTNSWNGPLVIDVAMVAEPLSVRGPVRRSDARAGDIIYVSGPLGGSIAGRHLTFTPRIDLAGRLALCPGLHAMMDISDGLSMDLYRMCKASNCAAELDELMLENIISDAARELAKTDGRTPLDHALNDGEDYELLVAGTEALKHDRFKLIAIGQIVPSRINEPTIALVRSQGQRDPIEPRGYEHFK